MAAKASDGHCCAVAPGFPRPTRAQSRGVAGHWTAPGQGGRVTPVSRVAARPERSFSRAAGFRGRSQVGAAATKNAAAGSERPGKR